MLHNLPLQGHLRHGLFNYNPKFFWMLARSNAYREIYVDYSRGAAEPFPAEALESSWTCPGFVDG
jgi:hypothetical protein